MVFGVMCGEKVSSNQAIDDALHLDGEPQNARQFYDGSAKSDNVGTHHLEYSCPAISTKLLSRYLPEKDGKLLDAGGGTGRVGIELQALDCGCVDGFDRSDSMAEEAVATGVGTAIVQYTGWWVCVGKISCARKRAAQ